jgi:thiamine-phosphate pyrophosphorylase
MCEAPSNPDVLRILDANLNRAREALRVMEEYARFGLADAALASTMKEARHALTASIPERIASALVRSRRIADDVGRGIRTAAEYHRVGTQDVAIAAGKRLGEALRAIEEYGKTIDPPFAAAIERIRYRGYELDQRLMLTAEARVRFAHVRLYVLLTESLCRRGWLETAEAALQGGADCIQLREKTLPDRELLARAATLAERCRGHGAMLIVNDRPDLAATSHAHGVHLGQGDLPVAAARRILPPAAVIGLSTHTFEQIESAAAEAPDYIAIGPMFATSTKPQERIAGPTTLREARRFTSLPLVAIGGITLDNAAIVLAAVGAAPCCLAVCTSVIAAGDVADAAGRLRSLIDQAVVTHQAPGPG